MSTSPSGPPVNPYPPSPKRDAETADPTKPPQDDGPQPDDLMEQEKEDATE